jgi:hypothetical protein
LIAGGIGAAFLAPSLFAATGVLGSMGPAIAGLLTNPFTAVIAGGLIVGAVLLGRKKQRQKEEQARDQLKGDVFNQLDLLLAQARKGSLDPITAKVQATQVVDEYYKQVAQFKTGSVKKSAENFRPFFNAKIQAIVNAAYKAEQAQENLTHISPEFQTGGRVSMAFEGKVPGQYHSGAWIKVHGNEAVLTPRQIDNIGGPGILGQAGVPGYTPASPVTPANQTTRTRMDDSGSDEKGPIVLNVNGNNNLAMAILQAALSAMSSPDGRRIILSTTGQSNLDRK